MSFLTRITICALPLFTACAAAGQVYSAEDLARFVDEAAQMRAVENLRKVRFSLSGETFSFVRNEGPWGTGRLGWRASLLRPPGDDKQRFIVFHTPMRVRGVGQQVFSVALEDEQYVLAGKLPESDTRGFRILSHDFDVRFHPDRHGVEITDTISMRRAPDADPFIPFRMGVEFVARKASAGGKELPFTQAGGVVFVTAPSEERFDLRLEYAGELPEPGFSGYVGPDEAVLSEGYWWPQLGRSLAPCRVRVETPKGWTAVAMGRQVGREETPGGTVFRFDMPLPYSIYSLCAGPYTATTARSGGKTYRIYQAKPDAAKAKTQLELLPDMLEFCERFGAYPFDDFSVVFSPHYQGDPLPGGTMLTVPADAPAISTPREVSQTWWGGMAGATYLNNLWPESFAEFTSLLYLREHAKARGETNPLAYLLTPNDLDVAEQGGVLFAAPLVGTDALRIARGKGAYALQMLEWETGTDALMEAMRRFVRDAPVMRPREWEHFQMAVSEVVGRDMRWFFDQWIGFTGSARLDLSGVHVTGGEGAWSLTGEVSSAGLILSLTVPVGVIGPDGTVDERRVSLGGRSVRFSLDAARKPAKVAVDPYWRLYRAVASEDRAPMLSDLMGRDALVVIPDEMATARDAVAKRLAASFRVAAVKTESEASAADTDRTDVIYYGSGKHPSLWELEVRFPIWEADGKTHLGSDTFATGDALAVAVLRNPRNPERLVGRVFGGSDLAIQPLRGVSGIFDRYGRPLRLVASPILTGPLTADVP